MTTHAKGTFEATEFDEQTLDEFDGGGKLTRARITQTFAGDLTGELTADLVMHYKADGTASFTGYQRFVGSVGDHRGGFVMEASGGYDNAAAVTTYTVIPDSGTDDLAKLTGSGTAKVPHGTAGEYTLDYDL
jgi:hypothetical protein